MPIRLQGNASGNPMAVTASAYRASMRPKFEVDLAPIVQEETFKQKAYAALRAAIVKMDIYASREPVMLDEREISEKIGVSRTPIREAVAMLEQEGLVRVVPRRGILVVRRNKREIIEMVQAWAALESMAVRLLIASASDEQISGLRKLMGGFGAGRLPQQHLTDYSSANIEFHQAIIALSGSRILAEMTDKLLLHVRGLRRLTIGRDDRAARSIADHLAIIEAIESRDSERAERLSREHTLGLAAYIETHSDELFE